MNKLTGDGRRRLHLLSITNRNAALQNFREV